MRIRRWPRHRLQPGAELRHAEARHRGRRLRPRRRDAQRPRAGGRELPRAITSCRCSIGRDARRIEDIWQYLYKGAYWRRGPVTMAAIARGRHGAVGHQRQDAGRAGVSAARRRVARLGAGLRPRQRRDDRRNGRRRSRTTSALRLQARSARNAAIPGVRARLRRRPRRRCTTSRREKGRPLETRVEHRALSRLRAAAVRAAAARVRLRRAPAPRRPSPPDADRGGAARQEPRAVSPVLAGGSGAGGEPGVASGSSASTRRRRSRSARCSTRSTTASS